jgi:hypothetical protein
MALSKNARPSTYSPTNDATHIFSSDFENDDAKAFEMHIKLSLAAVYSQIKDGVPPRPEFSYRLLIVAGDGDKNKARLAANMVWASTKLFVDTHFAGDYSTFSKFLDIKVVQGTMSTKKYPEECLEAYDQCADDFADQIIIQDKTAAEAIVEVCEDERDSLFFVGLKPPRDAIEAYKKNETIFSKAHAVFYGSFNFNSIRNKGKKNEQSGEIEYEETPGLYDPKVFYGFLLSFASPPVVYESFQATGARNSVLGNEFPEFFETSSPGARKLGFRWNKHICSKKIGDLKHQVELATAAMQKALDFVDAGDADAASPEFKVSADEMIWVFRAAKILDSNAQAEMMQMVLADPGVIAFMTGKVDCTPTEGIYRWDPTVPYGVFGPAEDGVEGGPVFMIKPTTTTDDLYKSVVETVVAVERTDLGLSE